MVYMFGCIVIGKEFFGLMSGFVVIGDVGCRIVN